MKDWYDYLMVFGVIVFLVAIMGVIRAGQAENCRHRCERQGLITNTVHTKYGVQCICTPPAGDR